MNITKALYHQNGLVRKSSAAILRGARFAKRCRQTQEDLEACPPVFVNSLPKSGTHLLNQLVTAFPNLVEYGAFLGSMTSSYRFRERSKQNTLKFIQSFLAKEIVRGHLFYELEYDLALRKQNVVHYFIYRDLRDVVVSEAYYLRNINRWHRLHAYFRELPTQAAENAGGLESSLVERTEIINGNDTSWGGFLGFEYLFSRPMHNRGGTLSFLVDAELANDWVELSGFQKGRLPTASVLFGLSINR